MPTDAPRIYRVSGWPFFLAGTAYLCYRALRNYTFNFTYTYTDGQGRTVESAHRIVLFPERGRPAE